MADILDYKSACEYIEKAASLGSRPGLERIRGLCDILGNPEAGLRFIHIAGTNGKGSTAAMIASALRETGLRVGMYYSPALCGIRDHYMINGQLISEDDYAVCVSTVAEANRKLIEETGDGATQFELECAVAFVYFSREHCDTVVLECGMGGRDDATNIVRDKVCAVIASVSYDHMQYLGSTLTEIASVKAGIITGSFPVIMTASSDEAVKAVKARCEETGSRLYTVDPADIRCSDITPFGMSVSYGGFEDVHVGLGGTFQAENCALALTALSVMEKHGLIEGLPGRDDFDKAVRRGIENVRWPFRFERINEDPLVFVDGAHNEDAAKKLRDTIRHCLPGYHIILVMGMFADKEYDKVAALLAGEADKVFTVSPPDNPRSLSAEELAGTVSKYCSNCMACDAVGTAAQAALQEAVRMAEKSDDGGKTAVIACGSLSYLSLFKDMVLGNDHDTSRS